MIVTAAGRETTMLLEPRLDEAASTPALLASERLLTQTAAGDQRASLGAATASLAVDFVAPRILPDAVKIAPGVADDVRAYLNENCRSYLDQEITLSNGPFLTLRCGDLYAHRGGIAEHQDGAGYTYGLVVIAEGRHVMFVGDAEFELKPGTIFVINSDEPHGTRSDGDGMIAFVTRDFYHKRTTDPRGTTAARPGTTCNLPGVSPEAFAQRAYAELVHRLS
ncbi:AraC family ligand binding domain-containing protein [Sphingomonas sp. 3-13AW]|uniref:AraC family ligand binding domain-containing protein n=1 Tax=Sphingomonas sp. 3-13AW TaxID=3050450 RepID=UPI003BB70985